MSSLPAPDPASRAPAAPRQRERRALGPFPRGPGTDAIVTLALGRYLSNSPVGLFLLPRGRIGRKTYWRAVGLLVLCMSVGIALLEIAGLSADDAEARTSLAILWPVLAISAKRFHDMGRSGWWSLINLVPYFGQLVGLVVNGTVRGTRGDNRFGPEPETL